MDPNFFAKKIFFFFFFVQFIKTKPHRWLLLRISKLSFSVTRPFSVDRSGHIP